jgi:hypothetical protein
MTGIKLVRPQETGYFGRMKSVDFIEHPGPLIARRQLP